MKKLLLIGLLLTAGNVFSQTIQNVPLNGDQEKRVKEINKQVKKQLDNVVGNTLMPVDEKKGRIRSIKDERNAQLSDILTSEQVETVLTKDPIKWDDTLKKIDKDEEARIKAAKKDDEAKQKAAAAQIDAEKSQKLNEVNVQKKDLEAQQSDLKKQMKAIESKQDNIKDQLKALKKKEKAIKEQYK